MRLMVGVFVLKPREDMVAAGESVASECKSGSPGLCAGSGRIEPKVNS